MAAATLLCRHTELVGATFDQSTSSVLTTVQGDGVQLYNLEQKQLGSLTLGGRSGLEFQVASVHHSSEKQRLGLVGSVVHDKSAKKHTLCITSSAARPISDAPCRLALPGPAQSCHVLHPKPHQHNPRDQPESSAAEPASSSTRLVIAAVLSDGRIGVTDVGTNLSEPGPLHVLPASPQQPAARHVLATGADDTLIVATQAAAGGPVTLRVLRLLPGSNDTVNGGTNRGGGGGLTQIKSLSLPCPGTGTGGAAAHAVPTGLTMSSAFALLQWSNGHATAVHGIQGGGAAAALRPCTFPLIDAVLANGASSSSAPPAAAAAATPASSRKRKNTAAAADGGAGARPRVLCAAIDDRQFVVLDLESAAAQSQVCFSLHDAQFGCPLSSGTVDVDAPLLSLDSAQCAVVAAGPEATTVRLGNAVHVLHIRTQSVSLLSLVARLSMTATAAAAGGQGKAAGKAAAAAKSGAVGGPGVARALATPPAPIALDQALLAAPRGSGQATAAAAAAVTDDAQDVVLESVPATAVHRLEDICNSLIQQLSAAATAAAPPPQALLDSAVSYIAGRRQHGMAVPPQLLSLAARGLAATKQWSQLAGLLQSVPQGGLCGCSDLLVAAAAAPHYALLPRLATCLDEVEPGALVDTLQLLLAPTTRSNLAARQQHYAAMRAAAEAKLAEAERTVAAAAEPPPQSRTGAGKTPRGAAAAAAAHAEAAAVALTLAQCAAAAVDGFSYREVLLHPLVAISVDAPAVQVELRRLSGPAADALLSYLAKWVAKYTGGAVGDAATHLPRNQELLFPYYTQVLEWTRMTVDAHLTRLLMARTPLPALQSLEQSLGSAVEGAKRLMMLRGALEHVNAAAPLPAAHIAVATQYTAEVLDLRVRRAQAALPPGAAPRVPAPQDASRAGGSDGGGDDGDDGFDKGDRPGLSDVPEAKPYFPKGDPNKGSPPPTPPPRPAAATPVMGYPLAAAIGHLQPTPPPQPPTPQPTGHTPPAPLYPQVPYTYRAIKPYEGPSLLD